MTDAFAALAAGLPELRARPAAQLLGADPVLPARLRLGEAAAAIIGGAASAAAAILERRGGAPQQVSVEVRRAAASLTSFLSLRLDGAPYPVQQGEIATMAIYRCADGRWIHLHGALPHLREGTLALLGCEDRREAIAAAVARLPSFALEDALAANGQCGAVLRTATEWREHAQGRALAREPLLAIERIGDAAPRRLPGAARPLAGLRVLDLTRILAAPTCTRTLAEHGADVLRLSSPRQPDIPNFVPDTSHGKRSALLDLDEAGADRRLRELLAGCDVFVQGYRQGALQARGFGPTSAASLRPGIVYVSIDAYGFDGPWAARRGWEQLVQACTGVALEHSGCAPDSERPPAVIPAAPSDYCSGHLAALGALIALLRQAHEGGSWHVRVSLARTLGWIRDLGPVADDAVQRALTPAEIEAWSETRATGWGTLTYLAPLAAMSGTPPRWDLAAARPGQHAPRW